MAQKTLVTLTCDVEGEDTPAAATHHFVYDGKRYVIDLSELQSKEFCRSMEAWVEYARLDKGPKPTAPAVKVAKKVPSGETALIRTWARDNGFENVGQRGRIPDQVVTAYWEAHP